MEICNNARRHRFIIKFFVDTVSKNKVLFVNKMHMSLFMRKSDIPYANNKGADQPAHPVVRCLDSIIPIVAKSKISRR